MPCSLDEAFAEADTIKIKKKKDRSKKKQFVYPEQINAISSIPQGNLHPSNFAEINQTTLDNYDLLPQVQSRRDPIKKPSVSIPEESKKQPTKSLPEVNNVHPINTKNMKERIVLSNKEYRDFLNYQKQRYNNAMNRNIQEGFSTINDDFNDVLLFGLLGIFFLMFTDYIYKLGKKSY